MSKTFLPTAACVLASLAVASWLGCFTRETDWTSTGDAATTGSLRMELRAGDANVSTATAVITGSNGFPTQTHQIDVSGESGVISIFFGSLPVGRGYTITLSAGACSGSAPFQVVASQVTVVPVALSCGGDVAVPTTERGGAQIVGTLQPVAPPSCDPISKLVAAPSVQDGDGPVSSIEVFLREGSAVSAITWTASSRNGGAGTIGDRSGVADTRVTFDCTTNGSVSLVADVTVTQGTASCVAQGRVGIECLHQQVAVPAAACGDGLINQPSEQCDGTALPSSAPAGSLCSASCTLAVPEVRCGNGQVETGEQCDGAALPASATAGSSCSSACTLVAPPPPPPPNPCAACVAESCAPQRGDVDASLGNVDPILDCVLGTGWSSGERVAAASCSNGDLLTCYCGTVSGQNCANAAPASLSGQCVAQILAGTSCTTSSCVAPVFLNPTNPNGKAMQYAQCWQDFCYEQCFNP